MNRLNKKTIGGIALAAILVTATFSLPTASADLTALDKIGTIINLLIEIKNLLLDADFGLDAIDNEVEMIEGKLDAVGCPAAAAGRIDDIECEVEAIEAKLDGTVPSVLMSRSDFALFTTEDVDGNGNSDDDYVECTSDEPFIIYASVVNYEADVTTLAVEFADGDLVTYNVPAGTSFSFSHAAGGTAGVDDTIRINPSDADDDGIGMAGWVSILLRNDATGGCSTTAVPP